MRALAPSLGIVRLGIVLGLALVGCGGTVVEADPIVVDDAGNVIVDAAADTARDSSVRPDARPDARDSAVDSEPEVWVDPGCPDAGPPKTDYACDPLKPTSCPSGQACFPYVDYPDEPCAPEVYRTDCFPAGSGKQGDPCTGGSCSAGYACVASGAGNVCVKMCNPGKPGGCPDGLVCQPTDVPGVGGCL